LDLTELVIAATRVKPIMSQEPLLQLELPGIEKVKSGKVREVFDLGDSFLFVATDRLSAFDVILPTGIARKGEVLTQISHFWFDRTESAVANHRLLGTGDPLPELLKPFEEQLAGRCMIVKKCEPLTIECVVRGYVVGSGWKDYQRTGAICGIELPDNLMNCSELEQPIFTPATKAEEGHDENISFEEACELVGGDIAAQARDLSLQIYSEGRAYARERGIIIADTKFEFGLLDGALILIDEVLTPDSSRFWPADDYEPGRNQKSFDKQFVREYLETLDWDKTDPGPELPPEIADKTREKYLEAYRQLTGRELQAAAG
jgi:phosphoribosylaminoimidazole-succinocarboxamide synthase